MNDYSIETMKSQEEKILKEKPWRSKKIKSLKLADSFDRLGNENGANYVRYCSTQLVFQIDERGKRRLYSADFCRKRLCPMCGYIKSRERFREISHVLRTAKAEKPELIPIFLTLTLRNCAGTDLQGTMDLISQGWRRLTNTKRIKRIVHGWYRSLEITYNKKMKTFHPHVHVILMVDSKYFTGKDYMKTAEWVQLWRKSMRLAYDPICDVRRIKGGSKALQEVAKYTVKDTDYLKKDSELTDEIVSVLASALRNRRLYAYGGCLKEIAKKLKAQQEAAKAADTDDGVKTLVVYNWRNRNYYADVVEYLAPRADRDESVMLSDGAGMSEESGQPVAIGAGSLRGSGDVKDTMGQAQAVVIGGDVSLDRRSVWKQIGVNSVMVTSALSVECLGDRRSAKEPP